MRIGLQTWGTDGDFFPFLALAVGLKDAGHEVSLAYTSIDGKDYSDHPLAKGIELIKADGGILAQKNINPYAIAAKPGSFKEYSKLLETYFDPFVDVMFEASEVLCSQSDLVIGHAVCHTLLTASEKHDCPRVSLVLTPLVVRSKYVSPVGIGLGPVLNSFLWSVGGYVATQTWFKKANTLRKAQSLAPIQSLQKELFTSDYLTIVAASSTLTERPKDWRSNIQMTGFLNLPSSELEWNMPNDLRAFIDEGEPPIYMTFGSCMQFDLQRSTQLLIEAAKTSGKRAIIQSDWSELGLDENPNIFRIEKAPHQTIFPHCSVIVHHGGAGTTQAALLSEKPSIVVAHGFDQPYSGKQLQLAQAGGNVFQRHKVTAKELADEIAVISNSSAIRQKASDIGARMKLENGVANAVQLILNLTI